MTFTKHMYHKQIIEILQNIHSFTTVVHDFLTDVIECLNDFIICFICWPTGARDSAPQLELAETVGSKHKNNMKSSRLSQKAKKSMGPRIAKEPNSRFNLEL